MMYRSGVCYTFALLASFFFTAVNAQNSRVKKYDEAIAVLNETDFIKKYREYKNRMEEETRAFKEQSENYDAKGVDKVAQSYDKSREKFHLILISLKQDLLNDQNRSFIISNPERFTNYISRELENAMRNYQENVVPLMTEVSGVETVGFGIFELKFLFDLIFNSIASIKGINRELDRMDEDYLDRYFIQPLEVTAWSDL